MTVRLHAADGFEFPAYVAQPKGAPKGAIVVLQEIFGVNAHIREVADGYAAQGYLAVAPATFHRAKYGVELGYTPDDMQAGMVLKTAVESMPVPGVKGTMIFRGLLLVCAMALQANNTLAQLTMRR